MKWQYLKANLKADLSSELRGRLIRRARLSAGPLGTVFVVYVLRTEGRAHEWEPVCVADHPELVELMREPDAWSVPLGAA